MRKGHNNSVSTLVDSVIGKPAPFESYRTFRNPLWIIRLLMESELRYISCISIIVGPPDIRRIRDIRIGTSHRLLVFIGSIVGYLIILQSLFIIFATGQLVPFIIGNAIPVRIDRDHHYPGFATTPPNGASGRGLSLA